MNTQDSSTQRALRHADRDSGPILRIFVRHSGISALHTGRNANAQFFLFLLRRTVTQIGKSQQRAI